MVSTTTLQALAIEYSSLNLNSPTGMYCVPSSKSILLWDCVLFIHQGYYAGSILRFKLTFKEDYPRTIPSVTFVSDTFPFHPLISQEGKMTLGSRFRPWLPHEHHVFDVLHAIKAAFKKQALDRLEEKDCLNREAFRYRESTSSFAALAHQTALLSQRESALYDRDIPVAGFGRRNQPPAQSGGVHFTELDDKTLDNLRKKIGLTTWEATAD